MPISTSPRKKLSEKDIDAIINKGGKTTAESEAKETDLKATKSVKLIMTVDEMNAIKRLRDKRQAPRNRKISISVHDWVIEAIQEKIERESRKYSV